METPRLQRLLSVARRLGCRVVGSDGIDLHGDSFAAVRVQCDDNEHAIRLLNGLAVDDAQNEPVIQELGQRFRSWADREYGPHAGEAIGRGVQRFVQDSVRFQPENPETFRSGVLTLRMACGDCDDHARLVSGIAMAAGLPSYVAAVRNSSGLITHACPVIEHDGRRFWAETTLPARYGEHPIEAVRRLGLARADLL